MGKYKKTNTQREHSHPQSKQSPELANEARMLKISHGQNCPPRTPEEICKRQASFQFHFISFTFVTVVLLEILAPKNLN
jgi:hypothetical protein